MTVDGPLRIITSDEWRRVHTADGETYFVLPYPDSDPSSGEVKTMAHVTLNEQAGVYTIGVADDAEALAAAAGLLASASASMTPLGRGAEMFRAPPPAPAPWYHRLRSWLAGWVQPCPLVVYSWCWYGILTASSHMI